MAESTELAALAADLAALDAGIEDAAESALARWAPRIARPAFRASAANLAHYLALRAEDRTALQGRLAARGLSTLGRSEGHVRATLRAVMATLAGRDPQPDVRSAFAEARARLDAAATLLLGPEPAARRTRILVTLEPAVALDPAAMRALIRRGADLVRINCAHDDADAWRAMAAAARAAAAAEGREVRVLMDLAGPKIRTADVAPKDGVRLHAGDRLAIRRRGGGPVPPGLRAACACTLPEAIAQVPAGAQAALDDGKIVGEIESADAAGLVLRVVRTKPGGAKLKADKGLNFPGVALSVAPLTAADRDALAVVAEAADLVGYSFVQHAEDMEGLVAALDALAPGRPLGVVAKIETELAFRNLPEIIVAGAGRAPFGVMIARGDLGVEIGFTRLSEVQEEILWACEAAHVPVVWATEVLASLVKNGMPARGDITDAAMGARAECVMLNKGPFLAEGVGALDDVLRRAERHLDKKTPQLAALRAWAAALA